MNESVQTLITSECTEAVRDPLWGTILLPEPLAKILHSRQFLKLNDIRQLGPTYLVYPGAVHTRFSHSLGVYELAKRMLVSLLSTDSRLSAICTREGAFSFLTAALLHDLGHFPYTHSLKDLCPTSHEELSSQLILESELKDAIDSCGPADAAFTAAIIDEGIQSEDAELLFYRHLLSGTLDPDKLDYLNRDAFFCGVPYGLQDTDFILSKLTVTDSFRPALLSSGLSSIENILFSKYMMYRNVYWHREVRSATAMIRKALYLGIEHGLLDYPELFGLDDRSFFFLLSSKESRLFSGALAVPQKRLLELAVSLDASDIPSFDSLRGQEKRARIEERIRSLINERGAYGLEPYEVILDIPEPVSFESNLPIIDQMGSQIPFFEGPTAFSPQVIEGFRKTVSTLRLFLPDRAREALEPQELLSVL